MNVILKIKIMGVYECIVMCVVIIVIAYLYYKALD